MILATIAIFLPSHFMAGAAGAFVGCIRNDPLSGAFLDSVNTTAVALMVTMAMKLGQTTLVDGCIWGLGLASTALLLRIRDNATWFILGGAALELLLHNCL